MDSIGTNVEYEIDEEAGLLKVFIHHNRVGTRSASGKSLTIATTHGGVAIPGTDGGKLNINFYRSA